LLFYMFVCVADVFDDLLVFFCFWVCGFLLHMVVGKGKISLHYFLGILLLGCDSVCLKKKKIRFGRNLEGFWRWVLILVVVCC
jgi:hypothetical protein